MKDGQRIQVLLVDDSAVIRRLVATALEQEPGIALVGSAANGLLALSRMAQSPTDVVILDLEMPEMGGLEFLRRARDEYPGTRVIILSSHSDKGNPLTLEALSLGADDYLPKASNSQSLDESVLFLRENLTPKIKQFFQFPAAARSEVYKPAIPPVLAKTNRPALSVVAIGVSTGGPPALAEIIPQFPADFPLPILIVQHMPAGFTSLLAQRLGDSANLSVMEAAAGDSVEPGRILIAPGGYHMKIVRHGNAFEVMLDQTPPLNSCRPAVDALFASLADVYGGSVLAVILTGMGQDGYQGTSKLRSLGATVLAQDEASSAVWGMPRAIAEAGLADRVLPLDFVVPEILRRVGYSGNYPRKPPVPAAAPSNAK